jgi:hypothetical protein
MAQESTTSRSILKPALGGLFVIVAIIAVIYFRAEVWDFLKLAGRQIRFVLTDWVPNHPGQAAVTLGFMVLAFVLNWIAHIRGRLRAWIFAIVVEAGLWLLFWYSVLIPSLNELTGLNVEQMTFKTVAISGAVIILVTGALFWFLESKEEWSKYRRRHHVDDD